MIIEFESKLNPPYYVCSDEINESTFIILKSVCRLYFAATAATAAAASCTKNKRTFAGSSIITGFSINANVKNKIKK